MKTSVPLSRCFFRTTGLVISLIASLTGMAISAPEKKPNILFLLADDARADVFGFAGNKVAITPNLDALANRSSVFPQMFVTTSICCVSRASILSGQHERTHRISNFVRSFSTEAWRETYPALLRSDGYFTGFVGKFGVGDKEMPATGFDFWRGKNGQLDYFTTGDSEHLTTRQADDAIDFLTEVPKDKPFCLSISFKAAHADDGAPREFPPDKRDESLFVDQTLPLESAEKSDRFFRSLPVPVQKSEGRTRWLRRFENPVKAQETARDYYRLISGLDREIGRILDELKTRGLADNTIVIFTSDNGFFLGERGMSDKWYPYEEAIRVPLIISDPRLSPVENRPVKAMALNIDLAPTLLDYAGVSIPTGMQGRSLRPWVDGAKPTGWWEDFFYDHYAVQKIIPPSEAVRSERWHYVRWVKPHPLVQELYDLQNDPLQHHNVAAEPGSTAALEKMRNRWSQLRDEAGSKDIDTTD